MFAFGGAATADRWIVLESMLHRLLNTVRHYRGVCDSRD